MDITPLVAHTAETIARYRAVGAWRDDSLASFVDRWADERPDDAFLFDGDVVLTWGQLRRMAWRTAASLRGLGVGAGERVVVQLPNWHEFVVTYFALARIGAVLVPAMPIYRGHELRHMISITDARAIVVATTFRGFDHLALARELRTELPSLTSIVVARGGGEPLGDGEVALETMWAGDDVPAGNGPGDDAAGDVPGGDSPGDDELGPPPHADDLHIIGFTSGTESASKGCVHTWNSYSASPATQARAYDFGPDDCELVPSPIAHTAGLAGGLLKVLLRGGRAVLMDVWDSSRGLELIDRFGCTQATGATAFIAGMVEAYDPARHDGSSFRVMVCGGAPVPEDLVRRAKDVLPNLQLLACYGMTEGLMVTSCVPEDPLEKIFSSDGRPFGNVEVELRDDDGEPVADGQVGNIVFRSPSMMLTYWRNPAANEAVDLPDRWRRTGDLAVRDADGYYRITGRVKEMIIRGGMNISTREIEELLARHPKVAAVAVVGLPDPILGERACAFVVPTAAAEPPTLAELTGYLLDEHDLARPKLPERLELVDALPTTPTGKVQKFVLRDRLLADR